MTVRHSIRVEFLKMTRSEFKEVLTDDKENLKVYVWKLLMLQEHQGKIAELRH